MEKTLLNSAMVFSDTCHLKLFTKVASNNYIKVALQYTSHNQLYRALLPVAGIPLEFLPRELYAQLLTGEAL